MLKSSPYSIATAAGNTLYPKFSTDLKPPWSSSTGFELVESEALGKGAFGEVFKARHRLDLIVYAIKQIDIFPALLKFRGQSTGDDSLDELLAKLKREVVLHSKINSSFVVRYHSHWIEGPGSDQFKINEIENLVSLVLKNVGTATSGEGSNSDSVQRTFLYIQTEFCNQTSLDKFLISATESEKLSEFPRIIYQTAKGLSAIHAQGIIHRDLKPDNIYATKKAGRDLNIWKIGDFGLSIKFGPSPPNLFDALEFQIDSEGSSLESFKGADTFRSPEMYNQHPYSSKTDIYSLALIFICVLFKFPSVKKRRAYFIDLQLGHCTPESVHLQETMDNNPETKIKYCSLIEKMLSHKPDERPDALEIYNQTSTPLHFYKRGNELLDPSRIYGREADLTKLDTLFQKNSNFLIITNSEKYSELSLGKTALVHKFLATSPRLKNYSTIWLESSTEDLFLQQLFNLCDELDIPTRQPGAINFTRAIEEILKDLCNFLTGKNTVIVFDDLFSSENIAISDTIAKLIQNVANIKEIFFIITTTHVNPMPKSLSIAPENNLIPLKVLNIQDGLLLLNSELGLFPESRQSYATLLNVLHSNPAALTNAIKVISGWQTTRGILIPFGVILCSRKVLTLRKGLTNLKKIMEPLGYSTNKYVMSTLTTFVQSNFHVQKFCNENELSSTILSFLYCIYPEKVAVDLKLFLHLLPTVDIQRTLELMQDFNLIKVENNDISLVKNAYLTTNLPDMETFLDKTLATFQSLMPTREESWVPIVSTIIDQAQSYPDLMKKYVHFILDMSNVFRFYKNFKQDISIRLNAFKKCFGPEHEHTLSMENIYISGFFEDGKFQKALNKWKKLGDITGRRLDQNHWLNIDVKHAVALLHHNLGMFLEAREEYEKLLELDIKNNSTRINVKANYALTLTELRDDEKALSLLNEVLAFYRTTDQFGDESEGVITAKCRIAAIYYLQDRFSEALPIFKEVLDVRTKMFGEEYGLTLDAKGWVVKTISKINGKNINQNLTEAITQVFRHVHSVREKAFGKRHPETVGNLRNLAVHLLEHGNNKDHIVEARDIFGLVLSLNSELFGESHPITLDTKTFLAQVLEKREDFNGALKIYEEILKSHETIFGTEHKTTVKTKCSVGRVWYELKQFGKAKSIFEQIYSRNKAFERETKETLYARLNFAMSLNKCGAREKAMQVFGEILKLEGEFEKDDK
ncbi:Interferon-induced, double-stranded RNA-activated protein kinase, partial [Folsomia candida]